jgi:asparagine synthase (glutamine-hydrolysing)
MGSASLLPRHSLRSAVCGISVVFDPAAAPESAAALRRMHAPIRHRGPDGEGFLAIERSGRCVRADRDAVPHDAEPLLGLAFRRLKILDLSEAAAQPMASADGMFWLAFNGEVYNFRELRRELEADGRVFRSSGDSEVVLAAFERWGDECFTRLEGMWAIVLADLKRRRLVASRDRFGIKPLYWALDGQRLLLASEVKQIVAVRGRPRANAALVALYLRGRRLPCTEETFFADVHAVPPGCWFEQPLDAPAAAPRFRRYWDLSSFRCAEPDRFALAYPDAVAEMRARLSQAVSTHRAADVGFGSLLSGGLDSATLVSFLADDERSQGRSTPTFSFGFRQAAPEACELGYVDAMVRRGGLEPHETSLDAGWIAAHAPRVVSALEEPPLALPALAQYRVFELCRAHGVTVVLDGQGADEILAGYAYHQRELVFDRLLHARVRDAHTEMAAIAGRQGGSARAVFNAFFLKPAAARLRARPPAWLAPDYGASHPLRRRMLAEIDTSRDPSRLNRRLHFDVKWGNAKIILGYGDRSAMAHSVEARVPYFDRRLVEFAFSLPDGYKVGRGDRKRILRDVARARLPPEITERGDRAGFAVPELTLMRGLWPRSREHVLDGGLLAEGCLLPRGVQRLARDFEQGVDAAARPLWRLYALALWRGEFGVRL